MQDLDPICQRHPPAFQPGPHLRTSHRPLNPGIKPPQFHTIFRGVMHLTKFQNCHNFRSPEPWVHFFPPLDPGQIPLHTRESRRCRESKIVVDP